jgi:hypothetical protein
MVISGLIATFILLMEIINSSGICNVKNLFTYCLTAKVILFMGRLILVEQW